MFCKQIYHIPFICYMMSGWRTLKMMQLDYWPSGGCLNIKMLSCLYKDSHHEIRLPHHCRIFIVEISKPEKTALILKWNPGPWFNIKISYYQYRKSHCGDKTVVRSSYLHNGISYTFKISYLYWIRAQITMNAYTWHSRALLSCGVQAFVKIISK